MHHGPSTDWSMDRASNFKTRIGIWMFAFYALVYAGFVLINSFRPELMGSDIGGLNLAVIYGFGLILFALILAFIYNAICSAAEEELNGERIDFDGTPDEEPATLTPSTPEEAK